jgi:hypothetical protein
VVDGTWGVTFSHAEMLAAGIADAGEDNPGNWGHFVMTLRAGTISGTQLAPGEQYGPDTVLAEDGTYVIKGTSIVTYPIAGDGPFAYTFKVTPTTLTFGGEAPVTWRVKPWTRVGP